jgi:glycosyl transferase family 87
MKTIDAERARRLAWLAMGIYIVGLGISATLRKQGDFNVYYRTGHRVLHGLAIYPPDDSDRFLYAPIFAIAFAPLAAMPRHLAQFFFFAINAFALVEFILGAGVILFRRERRLPAALIVLPVLFAFVFIDNNIEHGQINLPTLALIVWAIIAGEESRNVSAGAMLATAILIKPFAVFAALYLLMRGRFAVLGWTMVTGVALLASPIVFFGPHRWIDQNAAYLTAMASMTNRYRIMITNQSAVSAVARLMSLRIGADVEASPIPTVVGMGLEMILVAAVLLWDSRSGEPKTLRGRLALCALFCLMPSFAPISWKSYYAAMLLPYMALVAALWTDRGADEKAPRLVRTLFGLSIALNYVPELHWNRLALFYSAHFFSSILTLAALFLLWLRSGSTSHGNAAMLPKRETAIANSVAR